MGKQVCLHTHINHANEITWVTEMAAKKLFKHGVIVRNQSVLLKGVNDSAKALLDLIKQLARLNVQPYYIYQCDMVKGIEDLRTPLSVIKKLDVELRGQLSGFMMPSFVVDLPGGGGKRLVSTHESYENGKATYMAPGLDGEKGTRTYTYYDPTPVHETVLEAFRQDQVQALQRGETLDQFFAQSPPRWTEPSRREKQAPVPIWGPRSIPEPHVLPNFAGMSG
jgi:lysine 2,3-aminomutase